MRIQEQFKHISAGKLPQTVTVIVEGGAEECWRPGDDVVISGILDYRFKKAANDQKMQLEMVMLSNTIALQKSTLSKDNNDKESIIE